MTVRTDAYGDNHALVERWPRLQGIGCLAHARQRLYTTLRKQLASAVWNNLQIDRRVDIDIPVGLQHVLTIVPKRSA